MVTIPTFLKWAILPVLLAGSPGMTAPALAAGPVPASSRQESAPYTLARSAAFEVRSTAGEAYQITVAWPEGDPPPQGWPVLYILDGEDSFAIAALTARRLARAGERSGIAAGIVVGIGAGPLPRRIRDYTPSAPGYHIPAGFPAAGRETGGSEAFLDLLGQNIMPEVRRRWPVDVARETLVGHSFGGLLALHALLSRPDLFDGVVAISPSLWFGDDLIEREIAKPQPATPPRRLLVAEGDERGLAGVRSISADIVVQQLQEKAPSIESTFLNLPGQSHGTTFLAAIAPAIRFSFGRSDR